MNKKLLIPSLAFAATMTAANASLVFEETFNYTPGGTGTGAGTGIDILQNAGYTGNGGGGYSIVDGGSDAFTEDLDPLGYQNNSLTLFSGRSIQDLDRFNGAADTLGETYYFSFTFEYSDTDSTNSVGVRFDTIGDRLLRMEVENDVFFTRFNSGTVSTVSVASDTEYFVVGYYSVSDNPDNAAETRYVVNANVYHDAADVVGGAQNIANLTTTEPVSWMTGEAENRTDVATADTGISSFFANGATGNFESLRIGTTYESVAVPEPSSYALLSGFLALGWIMLRRR